MIVVRIIRTQNPPKNWHLKTFSFLENFYVHAKWTIPFSMVLRWPCGHMINELSNTPDECLIFRSILSQCGKIKYTVTKSTQPWSVFSTLPNNFHRAFLLKQWLAFSLLIFLKEGSIIDSSQGPKYASATVKKNSDLNIGILCVTDQITHLMYVNLSELINFYSPWNQETPWNCRFLIVLGGIAVN